MKKLYLFKWDIGRGGKIEGIFAATDEQLIKSIGKDVYLGEVLGKHSEIYGRLDEADLTLITEDQAVISALLEFSGKDTVVGYNPLLYIQEEEA